MGTPVERALGGNTDRLESALRSLASRVANGESREDALERVRVLLVRAMVLADLLGRAALLRRLDEIRGGAKFAEEGPSLLMPDVEFVAALEDIVTREPRLARTAGEVAEVYASRHGFAAARAVESEVTARVQRAVSDVLRSGSTRDVASKAIASMTEWTRAYAETVYTTNVTTAFSAGRIREGMDEGVIEELPAWRFITAGDADVRARKDENHAAARGLVADKRDPVWQRAMPPCGYDCRCGVEDVGVDELRAMGLLDASGVVRRLEPPGFAAFKPNPNFGHGRPDLRVYGG